MGILKASAYRPLADGRYFLEEDESNRAWYFQENGSFSPVEMLCGMPRRAEGRWFLGRADGEAGFRLCHSETGEMTQLLPEGINPDNTCSLVWELSAEFFLLIDCVDEEHRTYFSYNASSNNLLRLGTFANGTYPYPLDENNVLIVANQDFGSISDIELYRVQTQQVDSAQFLFSYAWNAAALTLSGDNRFIYISENRPSSTQEGDFDGWRLRSYEVLTGAEEVLFEYDYRSIEDEPIFMEIYYLQGDFLSLKAPAYEISSDTQNQYGLYDLNTRQLQYRDNHTYHYFDNYYRQYSEYRDTKIYEYRDGQFILDRTLSNLRVVPNPIQGEFYAGEYLLLQANPFTTVDWQNDTDWNHEMEIFFLYDWEANLLEPLINYSGDYGFQFHADENGNLLVSVLEYIEEGGLTYSNPFNVFARWQIILE